MFKRIVLTVIFLISTLNVYCQVVPALEKFITDYPEKSSFYFIKNDSMSFGINGLKANPMASLSKTIIALEFAYQFNSSEIDSNESIPITEVERFAIGDDNYRNWKKQIKKDHLINNKEIPLKHIVQGMIRFSANACADFLISKLNLDKINNRIIKLEIEHEPIFPFTASLLVAYNYENKDKTAFLEEAKKWSRNEYRAKVEKVHNKILKDDAFLNKVKKGIKPSSYQDPDFDKIWSNNFSLSSAKAYAELIEKINTRGFEPEMVDILKFIFESWAMKENPHLIENYDGISYKGAGTNSLVNVWLYLRNKDGRTTQFVGLFNDLNQEEFKMVEKEISNFGFLLSTDETLQMKWRKKFDSQMR